MNIFKQKKSLISVCLMGIGIYVISLATTYIPLPIAKAAGTKFCTVSMAALSQSPDNTKVNESYPATSHLSDDFYSLPIDEQLFNKIKGKSYKDTCPLSLDELRYLHVLHKNLAGETLVGEMICNTHIAPVLLQIFEKLYIAGYPIEKMQLIDEYGADDEKSMTANNSSSFNFRFISCTKKISKHGLGLAVDINPLYNPYVKSVNGQLHIEPAVGAAYVDRDRSFDYKIKKGDLCYKLFVENGFEWGGNWQNRKDYQHFEIPTDKICEWYPEYNR